MTRIKICGLTNPSDAVAAVLAGADAVGLVFAESRRQVSLEEARKIVAAIPPMVSIVGVFANEKFSDINRITQELRIDTVQLHGEENPEGCRKICCRVLKAIKVKEGYLEEMASYKDVVKGFLLDTYVPGELGGTGRAFDWNLAVEAKKYGSVILAGGLNTENIRNALEKVRPYGVDVSSGVETGGFKDIAKMRDFIEQVRRYDYASGTKG